MELFYKYVEAVIFFYNANNNPGSQKKHVALVLEFTK